MKRQMVEWLVSNKFKTNVYGSGRGLIGDDNQERGCKDEGKLNHFPGRDLNLKLYEHEAPSLTGPQFLDTNINVLIPSLICNILCFVHTQFICASYESHKNNLFPKTIDPRDYTIIAIQTKNEHKFY